MLHLYVTANSNSAMFTCTIILCTRRYGALQAPTSSSCGGLVAFSHLEGPLGPLDSCKKKIYNPIFFIGASHLYPPCRRPPYPLHRVYFFIFYFYFFVAAILDFTDVKNVTEGRRREGDQAWFFMWIDFFSS